MITGTIEDAVRAGKISRQRLGGLPPRQDANGAATIIPAAREQLDRLSAELGDLCIVAWLQYGAGLRASEALAVHKSNSPASQLARASRAADRRVAVCARSIRYVMAIARLANSLARLTVRRS